MREKTTGKLEYALLLGTLAGAITLGAPNNCTWLFRKTGYNEQKVSAVTYVANQKNELNEACFKEKWEDIRRLFKF